MKLILSRKGFDSASGGTPSPYFADGSLFSIPIPDHRINTSYQAMGHPRWNVGDMVEQLTRHKVTREHGAHIDPDLIAGNLPRTGQWRPLFGQYGAAQAHLRNQGVGPGDVFLFFGLFRRVNVEKGCFSWCQQTKPFHAIWGYMQIEEVIALEGKTVPKRTWFGYHPHCQFEAPQNTLYTGSQQLTLTGHKSHLPGAGVLPHLLDDTRLTQPNATQVTHWQLPKWIYPSGTKKPLSYHGDLSRWSQNATHTLLTAVARGQEFVLDCTHYPESIGWIDQILGLAAAREPC